EEDMYRAADE
nr:Chain B, Ubiquitin thioesterase otulin [Homo sapiens]4P0B_D Chain D, Ubiquitin thioesterase otulin [Homo sapiens]